MDDPLDLDLLSASLQADGGDVQVLLRVLADRLAGALGRRLQVERSGGPFRRGRDVRRLAIDLGDEHLEAVVDGAAVRCTIARSSGGIRIRTSKVSMEDWLHRLLEGLRAEATTSEATRMALEAIMLGDPS